MKLTSGIVYISVHTEYVKYVNTNFICSIFEVTFRVCQDKKILFPSKYLNDPKFSDRSVWANSVDPDQTAPRGAV